jgi:hypothetical protein
MAHVGSEWSHGMAYAYPHMTALDTQTWTRGEVPGLVDRREGRSSKGVDCDILAPVDDDIPRLNRINRVHIPTRCIFFFRRLSRKNLWVKRAWPRTILGWVTDREVFPGAHE